MHYHQAEIASERDRDARLALTERSDDLDASQSDQARQVGDAGHAGVDLGDGQVVHAVSRGTGVAIAPVSSMPFSRAVRPG